MLYREEQRDLFSLNNEYYLAHCIARDCRMGAGIAVDFQDRYRLRDHLLSTNREMPDCIKVGKVFNLITKEKSYGKPTYDTLRLSLEKMRDIAVEQDIKKIGMPKIASGLDRLNWHEVRGILIEVFDSTDIEIFVCAQ